MNYIFRIILVLFFTVLPVSSFAQVAIIVNKSNPTSNISIADLKNIFTGEMTKFASGSNITIVTYKSVQILAKNSMAQSVKNIPNAKPHCSNA
jgi:hypothetical protein